MPVTNYHTLNGELLGETGPGGRRFYGKDALGSVVATYDQNGTLENTYRYKPYGGLLSKTGSAPDPRFMWTGSTGSRTTGASYAEQYNRARHYGSRQAGWTSVDFLWPRQEPYGYTRACPTSYTDSMGLQRDTWGCRARTAGYSRQALRHNGHAWGLNCFTFVSRNICSILNASAAFPYFVLAHIGLDQPLKWLNCINRCLFDCWDADQGKGCSPIVAAGWRGIRFQFDGGYPPCGRLDRPPDSVQKMNSNRNDCCMEHIRLEQTQLTYCDVGGDCESYREIVRGTILRQNNFKTSGEFWRRANEHRLGLPEYVQAILNVLTNTNAPFSFPFDGSQDERIDAGQRLCCKERVWQGGYVDE